MKKYLSILLFAFVAMLCMSLSSCIKKDEPHSEEANLVGTWKFSGGLGGVSQAFGTTVYSQFQANGTGYSIEVQKDLLYPERKPKVEVKGFTYTYSGRELLTKARGEAEERSKITLTKDKLIMEGEFGGSPIPVEFVRVPDSEVEGYLKGK